MCWKTREAVSENRDTSQLAGNAEKGARSQGDLEMQFWKLEKARKWVLPWSLPSKQETSLAP